MTSLRKLTLALSLAFAMGIFANVGAIAQDGADKDAPEHQWTPGPAKELSQLGFLLGKWNVQIDTEKDEHRPEPQQYKGSSQVAELFDGVALQENISIKIEDKSMSMLIVYTYDSMKKVFRVTRLDSMRGMLDVMEGNFDELGKLILTNENNGTEMKDYETGANVFTRLILNKLSESKFEVAWEMSKDDGKTWKNVGNMTYTRAA